MSGVYSKSLARQALTNTLTALYTTPAATTAVIRTITVHPPNSDTVAHDFQVLTTDSSGMVWRVSVPVGNIQSYVWNGRLVLPAGIGLRAVFNWTSPGFITVSGYELT